MRNRNTIWGGLDYQAFLDYVTGITDNVVVYGRVYTYVPAPVPVDTEKADHDSDIHRLLESKRWSVGRREWRHKGEKKGVFGKGSSSRRRGRKVTGRTRRVKVKMTMKPNVRAAEKVTVDNIRSIGQGCSIRLAPFNIRIVNREHRVTLPRKYVDVRRDPSTTMERLLLVRVQGGWRMWFGSVHECIK